MWRWLEIYRVALDPIDIYRYVEPFLGGETYGFIYYSGIYDNGCGKVVAAFEPLIEYTLYSGGKALVEGRGSKDISIAGDPFTDLRNLLEHTYRLGKGIPVLGFISYESLIYSEESLLNAIPLGIYPLASFIVPRTYATIDLCSGQADLRSLFGKGIKIYGGKRVESSVDPGVELIEVSHDRRSFEDLVARAKERIYDGEVFQIVLSRYKVYSYRGSPLDLFTRILKEIGGNPYAYIYRTGDLMIVGASPEPLIIARGRVVETFPVAGTRRRIPGREGEIYRRLVSNEKERAEHMMLVDLARNDLGRIAIPGSVRVVKLMFPQILPNVVHLVSRVRGVLKSFSDSFEALRSLFPAGTVTGAPKHRAMKLIAEFEGRAREAYAGVIGFAVDRYVNFAITIRSAFIAGDRLRIQAGAGIVSDSKPGDEYIETENKMAIIERVLR
ncbi:MAG: anthranilate synthase component I family protein [Sulfolobales archaeon]